MKHARRAVLSRITAPTAPAFALADIKRRLRGFDGDEQDDAALTAIAAAVEGLLDGPTGILGRCLQAQTWDERFSCFASPLRLALAPVRSVAHVKYFDSDGVEQTIDSAEYEVVLESDGAAMIGTLGTWPRTDARRMYPVVVRFEAGYDSIPAPLQEGAMLLIGQFFEHRDAMGIEALADALARDPLISPFVRPVV